MLRKHCLIFALFIGVLLISSCDTSFQFGKRVMGIHSGKFFYTEGVMESDYYAPFEDVWESCEKALFDMKATDIMKGEKIERITYDAILEEDTIHITVDYIEANTTRVGIRVGVAGNNLASRLIHEKIKENLTRKR